MRLVYNNFIPFPGFIAINLLGVIFVRRDMASRFTTIGVNHESIHTAQMRETLYVGFYILYALFWLFRLLQTWNFDKAYRSISFEQEAYENEIDESYLEKRQPYSWIAYQFTTAK